jgi:pimeloyl-ACP methyl ester carboxylesterase
MENARLYGDPPYNVAVLHGGPGAPGEMAPVARELSASRGVIEPLQTAVTLEGQLDELGAALEGRGEPPFTLVGFSWGAWLAYLFAVESPELVGKLVLIGSGPFEEKYALGIMEARLSRLDDGERAELLSISLALDDPSAGDRSGLMARFGQLMFMADSLDPLPRKEEVLEYRYDVLLGVWEQAKSLRSGGELLGLGKHIRCPVVAIHGDSDPHPPDGVEVPLSGVLADFRFILLQGCGHYPWLERGAREEFYDALKKEMP